MAVISNETHLNTLERATETVRAVGIHMEMVSPGDFKQTESDFVGEGVAAIAVSRDGGTVNPEPTTVGYLESAKRQHVGVWTGVGVQRIIAAEGVVSGVETTSGVIEAPNVILAAGSWTGQLMDGAGLQSPFVDRDQVVGVFDVPPGKAPLSHTVIDLPNAMTYRYAMENRYVFQPLSVGSVTESALNADPSLYVGMMSELRERIVGRFRGLEQSVLQPGWSGVWNLTSDGFPIVGETEVEGLWVAAGFGNSGFLAIPAATEMLAQALKGNREMPDVFSPKRFPVEPTQAWDGLVI
ncbi:MAG: FAD-binding oxidoreductase [Chloroflexota bacterium]